MKTKFLIFLIFLCLASVFFVLAAQDPDETAGIKVEEKESEKIIVCLNNIIRNNVKPLKDVNDKKELKGELRNIKDLLTKCNISAKGEIKLVFDTLDMYLKDLEKNLKRDEASNLKKYFSEKYSETLEQQLITLKRKITVKIKGESVKQVSSPTPKPKENTIGSEEDVAAGTNGQIDLLILLVALLILLNVIFFLLLYLTFGGRLTKLQPKAIKILLELPDKVTELRAFVDGAEDEILNSLKTRYEKLDKKTDDIILKLKDVEAQYDTTREPPQTADIESVRGKDQVVPGQAAFEEKKSKPVAEPKLSIDFPAASFPESWKRKIFSKYKEREDRLIDLAIKIHKKSEIKNWFEIIGRRLKEETQDSERTFFKNIYPAVDTLRSKLSTEEFEEFKLIFFNDFLHILEIEEFGRKGEQYEPVKHQPFKIGNGVTDSQQHIIRKVYSPGYKMKYSEEVLEKAQVEL